MGRIILRLISSQRPRPRAPIKRCMVCRLVFLATGVSYTSGGNLMRLTLGHFHVIIVTWHWCFLTLVLVTQSTVHIEPLSILQVSLLLVSLHQWWVDSPMSASIPSEGGKCFAVLSEHSFRGGEMFRRVKIFPLRIFLGLANLYNFVQICKEGVLPELQTAMQCFVETHWCWCLPSWYIPFVGWSVYH